MAESRAESKERAGNNLRQLVSVTSTLNQQLLRAVEKLQTEEGKLLIKVYKRML